VIFFLKKNLKYFVLPLLPWHKKCNKINSLSTKIWYFFGRFMVDLVTKKDKVRHAREVFFYIKFGLVKYSHYIDETLCASLGYGCKT
jgi:hypothetical protein